MTAPGGDWVEQARRFVAGLAADPVAGSPLADWAEQARRLTAEHRIGDRLQGFLGMPHSAAPADERAGTAGAAPDASATGTTGHGGPGSAARSRAERAGAPEPGPAGPGPAGPGAAGSDATVECRGCPLCAGLAALRGRRPDLTEALADVLTAAATALRGDPVTTRTTSNAPRTTPDGSDAGTDVPAPDVPAGDAPAPPEKTVPHPTPAPVQRIDVA
ncbi:hypothetical protein [uncultured Modestobacter sp.]|uniref:hypothetical protein n=1 Tax=uncultured Modestobacter sp. TaxID=380048 RepID=UPI00262EC96E|nr:hypothetical protein [uncultured Modestobacter sp.]